MNFELRQVRIGLVLSLLSIFLGFAMGGAFGLNEDAIKNGLKESAEAVRATVYGGDDAAIKATLDKSWSYMKRAHMHLGAIGTAALIQSLLLAFLGVRPWFKRTVSAMLGAGALGYGIFWLLAGQRAPGLGSTGAAKESLAWLAQPSAGLCLLGTLLTLYAVAASLWRKA